MFEQQYVVIELQMLSPQKMDLGSKHRDFHQQNVGFIMLFAGLNAALKLINQAIK